VNQPTIQAEREYPITTAQQHILSRLTLLNKAQKRSLPVSSYLLTPTPPNTALRKAASEVQPTPYGTFSAGRRMSDHTQAAPSPKIRKATHAMPRCTATIVRLLLPCATTRAVHLCKHFRQAEAASPERTGQATCDVQEYQNPQA